MTARSRGGFTLPEMVLTLFVGLLALWLGLLLVARGGQRDRSDRFIADLQEFSTAFADHRRQKGAWPASTNGEVILPREMEAILGETNWTAGSPFGGSYGWVEPGRGREGRGTVVLTAFAPGFPLELTRTDLLEIDRRFDDGDLATGRFRTGFNGWPVYLVGENP